MCHVQTCRAMNITEMKSEINNWLSSQILHLLLHKSLDGYNKVFGLKAIDFNIKEEKYSKQQHSRYKNTLVKKASEANWYKL